LIIFEKIRWKNLLSYGNVWTEVNLKRSPNTLIVGENGSGKSTILDALCYVLFSRPFRRVTKKQLVNSVNTKGTSIEVEFTVGKNSYKVHRSIKTWGSQPFEIYVNGQMINQTGDSKDYQEHLETNILKLNFKSFTQIVILGSSSFIPFMQLSGPQRREIIEDLLDIKIFSSMNVILKDKVNDNKTRVTELKYHIDLIRDKIEVQRKFIDEIKQSNNEKIDKNKEEIEKTQATILRSRQKTETLEAQVKELQEKIKDKNKLQNKLGSITAMEESMEAKIKQLKKDIQFYETHDECPTCNQTIGKELKEKNTKKKEEKLVEVQQGLVELGKKYEEINEKVAHALNISDLVSSKQTEHSKESANITALNSYITKLNEENISLGSDRKDISKENKKLATLTRQLTDGKKKQEELVHEKTLYEVAGILLKDQGIKTKIIKQYVPIINKLVNKYLAAMDFFVNFELDENFSENIKSRHRDEFTYDSFSEGEKMRIDLALLFTWRAIARMKNSTNTNLLILDEVFDASLDNNGCDEFLKLIHQLGGEQNVFVISHKGDLLQDKFFSTIRFEKHKNFSRIAC
jgi:DNA repair exonuclease SbcCD ATPase subunit